MRARRIPLSLGTHVTGWHPMLPGHGVVRFESALRRDCIGFLARHPGFLRIRSQPTTISFVHADYARRYTPDVLVGLESVPDVHACRMVLGSFPLAPELKRRVPRELNAICVALAMWRGFRPL